MNENTFSNDIFDDYLNDNEANRDLMSWCANPEFVMNSFRSNEPFHESIDHEAAAQIDSFQDVDQSSYDQYSSNMIVQDDFLNDEELIFDPPQVPSSPNWLFGNEVQPAVVNTPISYPIPCEPVIEWKKPQIKKPIRDDFDPNDFLIMDENGKARKALLYEFLRFLLLNGKYSHIAQFVDRRRGIFRFVDREKAAKLWGLAKGRNGTSGKILIQYFEKLNSNYFIFL